MVSIEGCLNECGLYLGWSLTRMVSYEGDLSQVYSLMSVVCNEDGLSSGVSLC